MIKASGSLAADDVSVKCRVRRSATASNPSFDDFVDMTCTMRNWKPTSTRSGINTTIAESDDGPELLLKPLLTLADTLMAESPLHLSDNDKSNPSSRNSSRTRGSSRSISRASSTSRRRKWSDMYEDNKEAEREEKKDLSPYSIPLSDIVVVDASRPFTNITTRCMGYFEFTFSTQNAHDVLLAFLSNSLPAERIAFGDPTASHDQEDDSISFDVEALTATRLKETVQSETMGQKMRRKMVFFASRLSEMSALADCSLCEYNSAAVSPYQGNAHKVYQKLNCVNDQGVNSPRSNCNLLSELELETASCM
mmetsp:Transcript_12671/g.18622  ORF Transcript_12671/g.18622 Transcript_12671/m.18622 type:complete len:309 (+) Transcript_12671:111-1037(+)|eukprot:CAMPEP_0194246264 /NCGR_PEP_ID=MMETSP0158-20130606/14754_1 /TAXON_ID=33649 /ORGANISM="Thalassionema nitzschioides, Strain L26-B" /LENGTH=308 /DNA_ID=CAMNT_0038982125 /DNA_START=78 /DNA_END=1004 /DNA_ORIENTATION=-